MKAAQRSAPCLALDAQGNKARPHRKVGYGLLSIDDDESLSYQNAKFAKNFAATLCVLCELCGDIYFGWFMATPNSPRTLALASPLWNLCSFIDLAYVFQDFFAA